MSTLFHITDIMREIVHLQAGQCGNQIGAKVSDNRSILTCLLGLQYWEVLFSSSFLYCQVDHLLC